MVPIVGVAGYGVLLHSRYKYPPGDSAATADAARDPEDAARGDAGPRWIQSFWWIWWVEDLAAKEG